MGFALWLPKDYCLMRGTTMRSWELGDGSNMISTIGTCEELELVLDRLLSPVSENPGVFSLGPTDQDHFVQFGLSPKSCYLEFHPAIGSSVSYIATANSPQSDGNYCFDYAGTLTELPANVCISYQTMLGALKEYMATGTRPTCVLWSET